MSFPHPDGTIKSSPPEGWVTWWRRRTLDVCEQVVIQRQFELQRKLGLLPEPTRGPVMVQRPGRVSAGRVMVPKMRAHRNGKRGRR